MTDVLIVGGGIIGLACAHAAQQRGAEVLVLDDGEARPAAADVAAGMLAPVTEAGYGEDALVRHRLIVPPGVKGGAWDHRSEGGSSRRSHTARHTVLGSSPAARASLTVRCPSAAITCRSAHDRA